MASQQLQYVAITGATSGNNTLVAATTGYRIRVHSFALVAAGAVALRFESAADGTARSGVMSLITGVPLVVPFSREGHFETIVSELLNMELGGAVQVSGFLVYSLVA